MEWLVIALVHLLFLACWWLFLQLCSLCAQLFNTFRRYLRDEGHIRWNNVFKTIIIFILAFHYISQVVPWTGLQNAAVESIQTRLYPEKTIITDVTRSNGRWYQVPTPTIAIDLKRYQTHGPVNAKYQVSRDTTVWYGTQTYTYRGKTTESSWHSTVSSPPSTMTPLKMDVAHTSAPSVAVFTTESWVIRVYQATEAQQTAESLADDAATIPLEETVEEAITPSAETVDPVIDPSAETVDEATSPLAETDDAAISPLAEKIDPTTTLVVDKGDQSTAPSSDEDTKVTTPSLASDDQPPSPSSDKDDQATILESDLDARVTIPLAETNNQATIPTSSETDTSRVSLVTNFIPTLIKRRIRDVIKDKKYENLTIQQLGEVTGPVVLRTVGYEKVVLEDGSSQYCHVCRQRHGTEVFVAQKEFQYEYEEVWVPRDDGESIGNNV